MGCSKFHRKGYYSTKEHKLNSDSETGLELCTCDIAVYKYGNDGVGASNTQWCACHEEFGPPKNDSPRSKYFKVFGPPLKYSDPPLCS